MHINNKLNLTYPKIWHPPVISPLANTCMPATDFKYDGTDAKGKPFQKINTINNYDMKNNNKK